MTKTQTSRMVLFTSLLHGRRSDVAGAAGRTSDQPPTMVDARASRGLELGESPMGAARRAGTPALASAARRGLIEYATSERASQATPP
jgi:hypothetical protein